MIIEKTKNRKFQINSQMMNLLGCSKSDFYNLMEYMNYKRIKKVRILMFLREIIKRN